MGDAYQLRAQMYLAWVPPIVDEKSPVIGIIAQPDVSVAAEPEDVHQKGLLKGVFADWRPRKRLRTHLLWPVAPVLNWNDAWRI
jgi:hypothetical protein